MLDLIWGLAILLTVSTCLFLAGSRLARRRPHGARLLAMGTAGFLVHFATALHGRLALASLLPLSNVIVLGNALPPAAALVAGVVHIDGRVPRWRRTLIIWGLLGSAWYTVFRDLTVAPPALPASAFSEGVVVQSSPASCSASAAATLLLAHGIPADEAEMVALCLTRGEGTPPLGLYRGLVHKTRRTPWRVELVFRHTHRLADLRGPTILHVALDEEEAFEPPVRQGVRRSAGHTIVLFGFGADGMAEVGDPASGRVYWSAERLETAWTGEGLRLVPRIAPEYSPGRGPE